MDAPVYKIYMRVLNIETYTIDFKEHRDIFKNNEWYLFENDTTDEATTNP